MPVQQLVAEILFVRTSYVKKIIEDCSNSEETVKLLRFSCWENPQFSSTVLSELLWQVNISAKYDCAGGSLPSVCPTSDFACCAGGVLLHLRAEALPGLATTDPAHRGLLADAQVRLIARCLKYECCIVLLGVISEFVCIPLPLFACAGSTTC